MSLIGQHLHPSQRCNSQNTKAIKMMAADMPPSEPRLGLIQIKTRVRSSDR